MSDTAPFSSRDPAPPGWELLRREFAGDLDCSKLARRLYSYDASIYEELALGVARPRSREDCVALVRTAAREGVPLIARGGGTSLAGQCVGPGLVVEFTRYMNRILELDADRREAIVEPGLVQDDLNDAAAVHGLMFAPDTSTSRQATIGGMIGNNSAGAFSILFGTTREHVRSLEVLLADGTCAVLGPLTPAELDAVVTEDTTLGRITRGVVELIQRHRDVILRNSPKPEVRRRNTGYALDALAMGQPWVPDGPPFNLARLISGSEGTLGMITSATLQLVPRPRHRALMCVHCRTVLEACAATPRILQHGPAAVELLDGALLAATRHHPEYRSDRFWVVGDPGAVLAVELWDDDPPTLQRRMAELDRDLGEQGIGYARPVLAASDMPRVWALRKAGLGLLTGIPGDTKPVTAIEDIAVAPEDLAAFVQEMDAVLRELGCSCVYYGHASVGLLHYRPMLNLKDPRDLERFRQLLDRVVPMVRRYRGSISGEHGDGRLRSPYLREAIGPELYDLCVQIKRLFDPTGIFNPGKIVEAPSPLEHLRTSPRTPTPEIPTAYDWSRTLGLVRATEACNGVGQCRQSPGRGGMCPTYMATRDEALTTRARANLFRQALTSGDQCVEGVASEHRVAPVAEQSIEVSPCGVGRADAFKEANGVYDPPLREQRHYHRSTIACERLLQPGFQQLHASIESVDCLNRPGAVRVQPWSRPHGSWASQGRHDRDFAFGHRCEEQAGRQHHGDAHAEEERAERRAGGSGFVAHGDTSGDVPRCTAPVVDALSSRTSHHSEEARGSRLTWMVSRDASVARM